MVWAAMAAQLESGATPAAVAEWLQQMVPDLGWGEAEVAAFALGAARGAGDAATAAAVHAEVQDGLALLRGQLLDLSRLFDVQKVEIHLGHLATHDKSVQAITRVAEQCRRHVETLKMLAPQTTGVVTVADLMAKMFEAQSRPSAKA